MWHLAVHSKGLGRKMPHQPAEIMATDESYLREDHENTMVGGDSLEEFDAMVQELVALHLTHGGCVT